MPTIYEYLGIVILFYSREHEPIHIHAKYGDAKVKVSFYIENKIIYKVTYTAIEGKFPEQKLKDLKKFVSIYKYRIVDKWIEYFDWKVKLKKEIITKKI
jgi:hypothetical protein